MQPGWDWAAAAGARPAGDRLHPRRRGVRRRAGHLARDAGGRHRDRGRRHRRIPRADARRLPPRRRRHRRRAAQGDGPRRQPGQRQRPRAVRRPAGRAALVRASRCWPTTAASRCCRRSRTTRSSTPCCPGSRRRPLTAPRPHPGLPAGHLLRHHRDLALPAPPRRHLPAGRRQRGAHQADDEEGFTQLAVVQPADDPNRPVDPVAEAAGSRSPAPTCTSTSGSRAGTAGRCPRRGREPR